MERSRSLADIDNSIEELRRTLSASSDSLDNQTYEEVKEKIDLARKILTTPLRKRKLSSTMPSRRHSVALPLKEEKENWYEIMLSPLEEIHKLDEEIIQVVTPETIEEESKEKEEEGYRFFSTQPRTDIPSNAELVVGISLFGTLPRGDGVELVLPALVHVHTDDTTLLTSFN